MYKLKYSLQNYKTADLATKLRSIRILFGIIYLVFILILNKLIPVNINYYLFLIFVGYMLFITEKLVSKGENKNSILTSILNLDTKTNLLLKIIINAISIIAVILTIKYVVIPYINKL